MTLKDFQFHEMSFHFETFFLCLFLLIGMGFVLRTLFSSRKNLKLFSDSEVTCNYTTFGNCWVIGSSTILGLFILSIIAFSSISLAGPLHMSHLALLSILLALTGIVFFKRLNIIVLNYKFNSFGDLAGHYYQSLSIRLIVLLIGVLFALSCLGLLFICFKMLFLNQGTDILLERAHTLFIKEFYSLQFESTPGLAATNKTNLVLSSFFIALIGIQISPLFTQFIVLAKNKSALAPQLVWGTGFFNGGIMLFLATGLALFVSDFNSYLLSEASKNEHHIALFYKDIPFSLLTLVALLAIIVFYIIGVSLIKLLVSMISADLSPHLNDKNISRIGQKHFIIFVTLILSFISLISAFYFPEVFFIILGLSIAFSFQLLPALIGICYVPSFNGPGVMAGLVAGLAIVFLTHQMSPLFVFDAPPLGIHSTVWACVTNFSITLLVSVFTNSRNGLAHRLKSHELYKDLSVSSHKPKLLQCFSWGLLFIWFFFAIGPGAFLGAEIFAFSDTSRSSDTAQGLFLPLPSILIWHFIWWGVGVFLIWLLAYPLGFSKQN